MADLAQLERALVNADAAGDTQAARALAGEIQRMRSAPTQAAPDEVTTGDRARAGLGGINRGIAGILGLPVDTAENVLNLGRAGFGTVATALGRPDMAPDLQTGSVGGSQWIANMMERMGINASNPNPEDAASQMAFRAGTIAPSALLPGARLGQTAASAAGAAIGEQVGGQTGAMVGALAPAAGSAAYQATRGQTLANRQQANATRDATLAEARKEGFRFPPAETNPTLANRLLEGIAGKLTTRQRVSGQNAQVITNIAKRAVGLGPNDPLDEASLSRIRGQAEQAYEEIKSVPQPFKADAKLKSDIDSLDSAVARASKEYPDLVKNPGVDELKAALSSKDVHQPEALVELIKDLRFQAKENYKGSIGSQKASQQVALADAQRKAANMLESFIERSLSKTGQADLIKNFRDARTTIARTYDVESALNDASGTVNARVFASLSDKGRPLGGGLETIAKTFKAFPHDLKTPESIGSQPGISPLDFSLGAGLGLGGTAAAGPVGALAAFAPFVRPMIRSAITSAPYQAAFGNPNYNPMLQPDSGLAALLRGSLAGNMTQ